MKAVYEHINPGASQSIAYRHFDLPAFESPFHYHPEYELTYIIKGDGLRYVGSQIEEFREGELVLLGPNLPHCWINRELPEGEHVKAFVIQFHPDILEKSLLNLPEFDSVKQLLESSKDGFLFTNHDFDKYIPLLNKLKPAGQFLKLLEIFLELSLSQKTSILHKTYAENKDQHRFQEVFGYIIIHFRENISLEKVAEIAMLSPTSFCRYFKKITGKTLFEIILEYRLEAAAQLLLRTNTRISQVAFESGFEDIPYFNRTFKKWKGVSPNAFRTNR
jgi:AraC-like DNA-binding protein/mannose-6-phosphate isomerase-like protein (cupin superfamily)